MGAQIVIDGVGKQFAADGRTVVALHDITLTIAPGEFVCLLGPSGCGKTTTLRMIAGLEHPDAGEIRIGGNRRVAQAGECEFSAPFSGPAPMGQPMMGCSPW